MIKEHYQEVKSRLGRHAQLCIVSKKRSVEEIAQYYEYGERCFGENRVPELKMKAAALPKDIHWHFIGHLQRNKVRDVLPLIDVLQSLDTVSLAKTIEKEAARTNRIIDVCIELHLADEDTNKTGLPPAELPEFLQELQACSHIRPVGLMVMGPHTDDADRIHAVFAQAHSIFAELQKKYGAEQFRILSTGMSDDYLIALSHGSTMVRIGTYLFEGDKL